MQFPDNNVKDSKQSAHAYWSIATKREPERERDSQSWGHPVNAKLVILVRERSRLRLAKLHLFHKTSRCRFLRVKIMPFVC